MQSTSNVTAADGGWSAARARRAARRGGGARRRRRRRIDHMLRMHAACRTCIDTRSLQHACAARRALHAAARQRRAGSSSRILQYYTSRSRILARSSMHVSHRIAQERAWSGALTRNTTAAYPRRTSIVMQSPRMRAAGCGAAWYSHTLDRARTCTAFHMRCSSCARQHPAAIPSA